jgi:tripartite-type tricarboxylate transporter receptor subunit TctC
VRVCYVRSATGIQKWPDVVASALVVFGATAPGTAGNVDTAMLRNLFGIKLRQVQGYAGSADKRIAIERGEIDGDCGGFTSVPEDWLREGRIKIVIRLSPTLVPGMDRDIPWGGDLVRNADERQIYDFLVAPERLGRLFMVAGRVPAERIAMLRTAFDAMVADPEFQADAEKMKLLVTPMTGAVVARHVAELYATPATVVAKAKAITGD